MTLGLSLIGIERDGQNSDLALNDPEMLTLTPEEERVPILAKCLVGVYTRARVQEILSLGSRAY